ncbi:TRAP transporter large permease [Falsiroseomonas stagni]|uniref:TRAP transporter large permease protein n=1 Tax=Falsiroseomonas stagni DSM 19981 TaxID=1123062 RepID=A0A1I3YGL1_9PROT|nr:TRAP transporter large permease subunit [Falsiroseomonas stagni]SFK31087.1 TRAP transporter, DctM subunit [Falsiroseomonas stagni DSM 19981]
MTLTLGVVIALVIGFLGAGIWVGLAMLAAGMISLELFRDIRMDRFLASDIWASATAEELVTLPLFILMGEILVHTRISESLFRGLAPWTRLIPGQLLHVNVIGSTIFSAVSGSSAAGTATVGRITMPELLSRGYDRNIAMGSLAGAGTLGFLIPPSIPMIVYAVLADVSILDLFMAGTVPGLILAGLYMGWIAFRALSTPSLVPAREPPSTWRHLAASLLMLAPVTSLVLLVIGSMLLGFASITEAAAVGVIGALLIGLLERSLTPHTLWMSLLATVRTCAMIGVILVGALFLSKVVARLGIPAEVASIIQGWGLSPFLLIVVLMLFYLLLGTILDGLSTIVMTLPVTLPIVVAAGFDPVWFGVFLIISAELSQVSPPVGFNLYIIQALSNATQWEVARAALPFCLIMLGLTALITVFPEIVMWLPYQMRQ